MELPAHVAIADTKSRAQTHLWHPPTIWHSERTFLCHSQQKGFGHYTESFPRVRNTSPFREGSVKSHLNVMIQEEMCIRIRSSYSLAQMLQVKKNDNHFYTPHPIAPIKFCNRYRQGGTHLKPMG